MLPSFMVTRILKSLEPNAGLVDGKALNLMDEIAGDWMWRG